MLFNLLTLVLLLCALMYAHTHDLCFLALIYWYIGHGRWLLCIVLVVGLAMYILKYINNNVVLQRLYSNMIIYLCINIGYLMYVNDFYFYRILAVCLFTSVLFVLICYLSLKPLFPYNEYPLLKLFIVLIPLPLCNFIYIRCYLFPYMYKPCGGIFFYSDLYSSNYLYIYMCIFCIFTLLLLLNFLLRIFNYYVEIPPKIRSMPAKYISNIHYHNRNIETSCISDKIIVLFMGFCFEYLLYIYLILFAFSYSCLGFVMFLLSSGVPIDLDDDTFSYIITLCTAYVSTKVFSKCVLSLFYIIYTYTITIYINYVLFYRGGRYYMLIFNFINEVLGYIFYNPFTSYESNFYIIILMLPVRILLSLLLLHKLCILVILYNIFRLTCALVIGNAKYYGMDKHDLRMLFVVVHILYIVMLCLGFLYIYIYFYF